MEGATKEVKLTPAQQVHMCNRCLVKMKIHKPMQCYELDVLWKKYGGFLVVVAYCNQYKPMDGYDEDGNRKAE